MSFLDWLREYLKVEYIDISARQENEKLKDQLAKAKSELKEALAEENFLFLSNKIPFTRKISSEGNTFSARVIVCKARCSLCFRI